MKGDDREEITTNLSRKRKYSRKNNKLARRKRSKERKYSRKVTTNLSRKKKKANTQEEIITNSSKNYYIIGFYLPFPS